MTQSVFQRAALAVFILFVVSWYAYARSHAPTVKSVNGVYSNACCGEVLLQNGVIIAGKTRVPFKLEEMKFGLTGYASKRLVIYGSQLVVPPGADEGVLTFNSSGTTFTVCGSPSCDREYVFTRH